MNLIVGKLYTTIAKILIIFNILNKELLKEFIHSDLLTILKNV